MKWNRDENNWTELKRRAKRQSGWIQDNGFDMTGNYANQHVNNEERSRKFNQDKADTNMAHLHSQSNNMPDSYNVNEDNSHNPKDKGLNGFENEK